MLTVDGIALAVIALSVSTIDTVPRPMARDIERALVRAGNFEFCDRAGSGCPAIDIYRPIVRDVVCVVTPATARRRNGLDLVSAWDCRFEQALVTSASDRPRWWRSKAMMYVTRNDDVCNVALASDDEPCPVRWRLQKR